METRNIVTIFDSNSPLIHYVVKRLAALGYIIRVASSRPEQLAWLRMLGRVGQIVPLYANLKDEDTLTRAVESARYVINISGRGRGRSKLDFQRNGVKGAEFIARLSAAAGVERLFYISVLGAEEKSASSFLKSHFLAEQATIQHFPQATVFRTSVVFGPEDRFLNVLASWGRYMVIMPVIYPDTRLQPVYAGDIGDALRIALQTPATAGKVFELAGPRVWTVRELMTMIMQITRRPQPLVNVSPALMRMAGHLLRFLPGEIVTPDIIDLLVSDSIESGMLPGLSALGIVPTPVEMIASSYLFRYRVGGEKRPIEAV
ncbi:complex I NDUFA9 subunit family protein [Entomobacter blattae]|uniref:NADH dehydrogenase n=1 Tax=Entomobacter blattae TaxID=2762277 RepID=A0A7H1NSQ6_9PROT|nr:complex I NDUFA9 subunit family protein [Entomobacter blattae]QNT78816.1 hypothetical protein JGUZn3_15940 [Entomobacter blattae]